jgi:hypothetical protein
MTERTLERQAIRAALALAAASAHGRTPEAIADMREEAGELLEFWVGDYGAERNDRDALCRWCDDSIAMVQRLSSAGSVSEQFALNAAAAILRFRLAVVHQRPKPAPHTPSKTVTPRTAKKNSTSESVQKKQRMVFDYIAQHPNMRTKDLVEALEKSLSIRTMKRCLKELVASGTLRRAKLDDGGVSYSVDTKD